MDHQLEIEAEKLGINYSLYNLIPSKKRMKALRTDIEKEKKRREEIEKCGKKAGFSGKKGRCEG